MSKRQELIKELDRVFSIFIRKRDVRGCISCSSNVYWKDGDNGHFIPRANMSTRYDERCCNLQCISCNRYEQETGNVKEGHKEGLIKKYGDGIIKELEQLGKETVHLGIVDLAEMLSQYKLKI